MRTRRLVLFAHGSPDERWREPFVRLLSDLRRDLGEDGVDLAYMEFVRPNLLDAAAAAAAQETEELEVLPLFMSAGGHVARDLPKQVEEARKSFPRLIFNVAPPVGEDPRIIAALKEIAKDLVLPRA